MKLNKDTNHWLKNKPSSYVNTLKKEELLVMDLGECMVGKKHTKFPMIHEEELRHYPHKQNDLKKEIAKHYFVNTNMISLGNGSDEVIEHIPQIFIDKGDHVLFVVPTFFRFIDASLKRQAQAHLIKTKKEDKFTITDATVKEIIATANKTHAKLIWLCSPNNPTGIPIRAWHIEKIIKSVKSIVVLDQVYAELQEDPPTVSRLLKMGKNLIILKSFSKVFGLAGIRVGFAIADKKIINTLELWRLPFNISSTSLIVAKQILEDKKIIPRIKSAVQKERKFLFDQIKRLENFELIDTSETNIFLLRHKTKDLFIELLEKKILVADLRNSTGLEQMNFARITIGNHKDNQTLLKALKFIN